MTCNERVIRGGERRGDAGAHNTHAMVEREGKGKALVFHVLMNDVILIRGQNSRRCGSKLNKHGSSELFGTARSKVQLD